MMCNASRAHIRDATMTHTLRCSVLALVAVPLVAAVAPAQVKEPPRAEKVDVQIRYRIRADRDERVRQYRALEKHLESLGFVDANKDDPDRDLDILDPAHERFVGTLPGAKVLDILKDSRVQNILFAPSGFAYPDAPDKPVAIRIALRTGFQGPVQQQFHKQVVEHLGRMGLVESLGYDTRGYTLVRGSIPYKNLDRLVKDVRFEPSGWFLAETPLSKLPVPLRDRNPLLWTEVLPITEFPPSFESPPVLPAQFKYSADLRAALGTIDKNAPLRVEVVFQNRLGDLEALRVLIAGRYAGASLDGFIGNVASIRLPRASLAEQVANEPTVLNVRLPRQGAETIAAGGNGVLVPQVIKDTRLGELHARGYTGAGVKVVLVGSDFSGVEKLIGTELPKRTRLIDLTTELSPDLLPAPPDPTRLGTGTIAARALAAVAPDVELSLVRIDPGCFFHLYTIVRLARGELEYTDALQVRMAELGTRSGALEAEKNVAVAAYKAAYNAPAGNPIATALRKKAEDDLKTFLETEKDPERRKAKLEEFKKLSTLSDTELAIKQARDDLEAFYNRERQLGAVVSRFNAYQKELGALAGAHLIVNTLVWESGYPLDGLNEFAGTLDKLAAKQPPTATVKATAVQRPQLVWVQAATHVGASVWGGLFVDANRDGLMEFAPFGAKLPAEHWTPQLNFLGTRTATGEVQPELAKGTKLRFVVQWREPADPNFPGTEVPAYPLTLRLLRQLDPAGTQRASDEMLEVVRSIQRRSDRDESKWVGVPNVIFRTPTFLVYEQMLEYEVPEPGRFALVLESSDGGPPPLPALRRDVEIAPRMVVETLGTAAGDPRVVFRSFTSLTAGVGTPGDSMGAITVGTDVTVRQSGGGVGVLLRVKPDVIAPDAYAFGPQTYSGEGVATAFAGGAAALLLQAGATGPNVFLSTGIEQGKPLDIPVAWLRNLRTVVRPKR